MTATIPSDHLAQQNKVAFFVCLSSGKKQPQKPSQLPTSLRCGLKMMQTFTLIFAFLAKLAEKFLSAMVHAAIFLRNSLASLLCYPAVNHNSMILIL